MPGRFIHNLIATPNRRSARGSGFDRPVTNAFASALVRYFVTVHQAAASVQHRSLHFGGMSSRPAYCTLRLWQIIQGGNYFGEQRARFTDTAIVCINGSGRYYIFLLAIAEAGDTC
jgi:hypothetical protein